MSTGKTYTIEITHLMHGVKRTFFIFQELPEVNHNPSGKIFANIFDTIPSSIGASDGSVKAKFRATNEFFAMFGTKTGDKKAGVETSSYKTVKLGPDGSVVVMTTEDNAPKWDDGKFSSNFEGAGGFQFKTDKTFHNPNNIYIGVGARDPKNIENVIPLQTFKAEPSLASELYPKVTYFVGTGDFTPGQFVDKKDIGKAVQIDFQTATSDSPTAKLRFDNTGSWQNDPKDPASNHGIKVTFLGLQ